MDTVCSGFPKAAHDGVSMLELQRQLRLMCSHLRHLDLASQKQSTLNTFFQSTKVDGIYSRHQKYYISLLYLFLKHKFVLYVLTVCYDVMDVTCT